MNNTPDFQLMKKLWTLKTVVDGGSLKQAALRDSISVSAVSQTLKGLEQSLGKKLFSRRDRKIVPTEYCNELLVSLEPTFSFFSEFNKISQFEEPVPKMSWLDFGACRSVAGYVLAPLVKELMDKLPKLKLDLTVSHSQALCQFIKRGELCMALVTDLGSSEKLNAYPVYKDRLGLYCSSKQNINEFRPDLFSRHAVAVLAPQKETYDPHYKSFFRALGSKLKPQLVCDNYDTLVSLVSAGTVFAVLPQRLALSLGSTLKEIIIDPQAGIFNVSLISQRSCDPLEDEFLIRLISSAI